jgi:hypothetical protein
MREATNNLGFYFIDGKFCGICLGHGYCAEHEWGTEGIDSRLRVASKKKGKILLGQVLDGSAVTYVEKKKTIDKKRYTVGYLFLFESWIHSSAERVGEELKRNSPNYSSLYYFDKNGYRSTWSDRGFLLNAVDSTIRGYLSELADAFHRNDVARGCFPSTNPFDRSSLAFVIPSKMKKPYQGLVFKTAEEAMKDIKKELI